MLDVVSQVKHEDWTQEETASLIRSKVQKHTYSTLLNLIDSQVVSGLFKTQRNRNAFFGGLFFDAHRLIRLAVAH